MVGWAKAPNLLGIFAYSQARGHNLWERCSMRCPWVLLLAVFAERHSTIHSSRQGCNPTQDMVFKCGSLTVMRTWSEPQPRATSPSPRACFWGKCTSPSGMIQLLGGGRLYRFMARPLQSVVKSCSSKWWPTQFALRALSLEKRRCSFTCETYMKQTYQSLERNTPDGMKISK